MSPVLQQFKHEKNDQVSNSAQHGHQASNKEGEQFLRQDLSKRIKIWGFLSAVVWSFVTPAPQFPRW